MPEEYGGLGLDLTTYALAVSELARGWMSVSGIINTHFIVVNMLMRDGTEEQKERLLPRMATGEIRGAFSMTEPECGSDVQAIRSTAVRDGDDYVVNGQKMWVTNGLRSGVVATLVKTDTEITPAHNGMSVLLVEKTPGVAQEGGLTIPPQLEKLGYKGVETTELVFADHRVPAANLLGGEEGAGLRADDVGRRGRPRERRRPRCGRRPARVRARHPLRPGAPRVRQARSPSTRASSSSWPRWRPRSRPRGC